MLHSPRLSTPYMSCPPGFGPPDFRTAIDLPALLAQVPAHATGKGMFLAKLLAELDELGIARPTRQRFLPFSDYPLTQCMELNLHIARLMYPRVTDREALRRVAWRSFTTFGSSMLGRMVFGVLANDPLEVLGLSARALPMTTNVGSYELERIDDEHLIMHVRDSYMFLESFGAGMIEGLFTGCQRDGEVLVRRHGETSCSFFVGLH